VVELLGARLLEREDLATRGVDAREDVADRAVLAGAVHALEHDEERAAVAGEEEVLELGDARDVRGEQRFVLLVGRVQRPRARREAPEVDVAVRADAEAFRRELHARGFYDR
jgi:hypothetical protein